MLQQFLIRVIANGLGLWIAAELIGSVSYRDDILVLVIATLLFSVVNAVLRPILILLSLPAIIFTLGLFTLVVNGLMLYVVTWLYPPFAVEHFGAAIITVIIIWVVNFAINTLITSK